MKLRKSIRVSFIKHRSRAVLAFCAMFLVFMLGIPHPPTAVHSQEPKNQDQENNEEPEKLVPEEFKDQIPYLSSVPGELAARSLGMTEIMGKPFDESEAKLRGLAQLRGLNLLTDRSALQTAQVPSIGANVGIGTDPTAQENEPTVVANPQNDQLMVAGSHRIPSTPPFGVRCLAFTSSDGGSSWSVPFEMPQLTPQSQCSDPVLAYAPDGNRVYYAYMDIKPPSLGGFDIVVSYSNNNGQTWIGPVLALDGSGLGPFAIQYDKPWIGTHVDVPGTQFNNNNVYLTATAFRVAAPPSPVPPISIAFTNSFNQGVSWGTGRILDTVPDVTFPNPQQVIQGSRPVGGLGNDVLVAWYSSGTDGWLNGGFEIRTARSSNNGFTFDPTVTAATDSFEVPFRLGPLSSFHRWWITMGPDVEIDTSGVAHIVYTHDPVAGSTTAEDGDIRYVSSAGRPYNVWTSPTTISDDASGQAQGYPALETIGGAAHVIFEDHRLSPSPAANILYDMFYTQNAGGGWEANSRVTDASSISENSFIGDYNDLTARPASGSSLIFGIWTDRRDKISIFDFEDDVWGARISPSGT